MRKLFTSMVVIIIFSIAACKKNDSTPPQTTLQKIQNNWLLDKMVYKSHFGGSDYSTTTTGISTDYFEFRSDGKIYFSLAGNKDTVTYSLNGDTKILIDGTELYDINALTANSFIIYKKEISGSNYDEETITWKR